MEEGYILWECKYAIRCCVSGLFRLQSMAVEVPQGFVSRRRFVRKAHPSKVGCYERVEVNQFTETS